jgi:hypothetical protein
LGRRINALLQAKQAAAQKEQMPSPTNYIGMIVSCQKANGDGSVGDCMGLASFVVTQHHDVANMEAVGNGFVQLAGPDVGFPGERMCYVAISGEIMRLNAEQQMGARHFPPNTFQRAVCLPAVWMQGLGYDVPGYDYRYCTAHPFEPTCARMFEALRGW